MRVKLFPNFTHRHLITHTYFTLRAVVNDQHFTHLLLKEIHSKDKLKTLYFILVVPSVTKLVSVEADGMPFTPFPLSALRFKNI